MYLKTYIHIYVFPDLFFCLSEQTPFFGLLLPLRIPAIFFAIFPFKKNSLFFILSFGPSPDYGVALVSRIDKIIGLFCKRAL